LGPDWDCTVDDVDCLSNAGEAVTCAVSLNLQHQWLTFWNVVATTWRQLHDEFLFECTENKSLIEPPPRTTSAMVSSFQNSCCGSLWMATATYWLPPVYIATFTLGIQMDICLKYIRERNFLIHPLIVLCKF
jgi:hypothetical protein